jgi:hypothetical protein
MHRVNVGRNEPVEVLYDADMFEEARTRADRLGRLKNSITGGKSNVWGMLGEDIIATWVDGMIMDDFQYDVLDTTGKKLEVKTKKTTRLLPPERHYECSVCNFNAKQRCDAYVFVRICTLYENNRNIAFAKAWICGWKEKSEFLKEAQFFKKDEYDPRNDYKVHADCWNMPIGDLNQLDCI